MFRKSKFLLVATFLGILHISLVSPTIISSCKQTSVPVENIQLNKKELKLVEGETEQLTAKILPEDATNKNVTWSSSDSSIATVDDNGKVTAVKIGNAIITATAQDGSKTAKCEVDVIAKTIPIENIQLDKKDLKLVVGGNEQLTATILPENATNKNVIWSSSDEKVATVDQTGLVTAVSVGTTTVTVTAEDGSKTAKCEVDVIAKTIPVENIQLDKKEFELSIGQNGQLTATISPENATNKKVTWISSDENIAPVDQTGLVTAVSVGTVTVTVTTEDGSKTATCQVNIITKTVPVESVKLDKTELELTVSQTYLLAATVLPENATNKKVSWKSSDENIATIDQTGLVTAISIGTTTVTVTTEDGGKTATCQVIVNQIPVENIQLDKKEFELSIGQKGQLTATISPEDATNKKVTWISSDKNVATVNEDGIVYAVRVGKAIITVITNDGGKTDTCEVTVKPIPVEGVLINKNKLELTAEDQYQLKATVIPENATNKNVIWSSSNSSVLICVQKFTGIFHAYRPGNATVTVTTIDGSHTATCEVTVKPLPVESIQLNKTNVELMARSYDYCKLIPTILPKNASNKEVTWFSSDKGVATVSEYGIVVPVRVGKATITVITNDGGKTATCEVTVKPVPVEGVYINVNKLTIAVKTSERLIAIVIPEDAANKNVTWESNNPSIAAVDNDGLVTGISAGEATIIVTTNEGDFKSSCVINVVNSIPVWDVSLNKSTLELTEGCTEQLDLDIIPKNATNKNVTWSSSNDSVATVDQNGLVTAISIGKTTITVTTEDGGLTTTCNVTVGEKVSVESVLLNKDTLKLNLNTSEQLIATVLPNNAANKNVTWNSKDLFIAKVNQYGVVTVGSYLGNTTITVTTEDGGMTASCEVYVVAPTPVESIQLDKSEIELAGSSVYQLTATVLPENASYKKVIWSSDNLSIAKVYQNGLVTGVGPGNTTITATTRDGFKVATCKVVVKLVPVESVKLDKTKLDLSISQTYLLTATVLPENATNKKVTWKSSNESIATVDQNGLVEGIKTGYITITVATEDGNKLAKCMIKVISEIHVQSIKLDKNELDLIKDETNQLTTTILPENATNKEVTWESSDPSIAIVDENGLVKAVSPGNATITATTQDGSKTATCNVVVKIVPVENVLLNKNKIVLGLNTSTRLIATVLPENTTNQDVQWSTNNDSIVIVDQSGLIAGINLGPATVTVTTEDGGKTATCEISVVKTVPVESIQLSRNEITLNKYDVKQLKVTVLPEYADNKNVTWSSSNSSIVTVDENGWVKAVAVGTATIIVTTEDGGKTAICRVTVQSKQEAFNSISMNLN